MTFRPTLAGCACLLTLCWPAATSWSAATEQDPATQPTRQDPALAAHLKATQQSFGNRDYLAAGDGLQDALALVRERFEASIRKALPRTGKNHLAVDPPPPATPGSEGPSGLNPMRAMMLGVDRPVEQRYQGRGEHGMLRLMVLPRTPAVRQAQQLLDVAEERENVELLEIGRHVGTLETGSHLVRARFVLGGAHVVEIQGISASPEDVSELLDARALDALAEVLTPRR